MVLVTPTMAMTRMTRAPGACALLVKRSDHVDKRDVVFTFSSETYNDAVRRGLMRPPDRIMSTLMHSDRVDRLLVANPFRWSPSALIRRAARADAKFPTDARRSLYSPVRWERADATDVEGIERQYVNYDRLLASAARQRRLDTPVVITTNPVMAGFSPLSWSGPATYFGRDDWSALPGKRPYWPVYREAYRRIADSGRAVVAVSDQIIERIAPRGPYAVVPNGVEPAEWVGDRPPAPEWLAAIPAPRAVYVGTLDSRLDVEGLRELAVRKPTLQVVLVGPVGEPGYVEPLEHLPNVHVHPGVQRAELVAVLRSAELCLLAHRRTPLTEAMSPLKVYEYLAAGCPVVSVDLAPVRGLGERVVLVDSVSDFADVVDSALAGGRAPEAERVRFVAENSWTSRHERILDLAFR
jgi:glycosyltransferase involved in cell wall biosynthesis